VSFAATSSGRACCAGGRRPATRGWQAHGAELPDDYDDDLEDVPPVVFFCPVCAEREFRC
jgi:hypothetical protein